jgi:beta-barrel assembly-enhancing protease
MNKTFRALYFNESNYFYNAEIFISSVTLTMRYKDEQGQVIDRHWLGEDIVSLEETELEATLIYRNEAGKPERLVIRDRDLLESIRHHFRHHRFAGKRLHYSAGKTRNRILVILAMLITVIAAAYFFFVPWLGEKVAMKFSKEKEIALGDQMYNSLISGAKVDIHKTEAVNAFYKALHYGIDYPIQITVVESDEVNAFAVPGGHIVVYDAILDGMKTPEELAALLGHEASHVALRHSLRNIFRSLARKMFLLMVIGGDAGIAGYIADRADDLKGLEYSRSLETEADDNGIQLMRKSGINPVGMLRLMELLQKEGTGKEPSALLSTHPVFESRIKNINRNLAAGGEGARQKTGSSDTHDTSDTAQAASPGLRSLFHEIYESPNSY